MQLLTERQSAPDDEVTVGFLDRRTQRTYALHESLVADDSIKQAIQHRASAEELRTPAMNAGMTALLQDGIEKVLAGLTDPKRVLAVCSR